ncbi:cell division protein SepF [Coprothermobacteraceae bacterium]|nr:cell division protein SepF [Coprothermobacteraceae bacterium]
MADGFWKKVKDFFTGSDEEEIIEEDFEEETYETPVQESGATLREEHGSPSNTIWVYKPTSFSFDVDSGFIGSRIREGYVVLLNLEDLDDLSAQRLIDFVSGALYSVEGKLKAVSGTVFLLTPKNMRVESFEEGFGTK